MPNASTRLRLGEALTDDPDGDCHWPDSRYRILPFPLALYVSATLAFMVLAVRAQDVARLWSNLREYTLAEPGWLPSALAVLAAYLIGSILRALPIGLADDRIGMFVRWIWKWWPWRVGAWTHRMYDDNFPYRSFLEHHLRNLGSPLPMEAGSPLSLLGDDTHSTAALHARWEYWKAYLYLAEPNAVPLVHELETWSRMFCGMLWAGLTALGIAGLGATVSWSWLPLLSWTVSLPMVALFGWRLRHVRCEEARRILLAFVISRFRGQGQGVGS